MKSFIIACALSLSVLHPAVVYAAEEITLREALIELIERLTIIVETAQEEELAVVAVPQVAGVAASIATPVDPASLLVIVDGAVIFTSVPGSNPSARNQCEGFAYDTTYMGQFVECVYDGALMYSGVFIPG
jgi:hypothetical protein